MCQIFIICSLFGLLGCFYFLAVLNKAAINLDVHVSEHKCKNSKQNSCKRNSGAHKDCHTLCPCGLHPGESRLGQHM